MREKVKNVGVKRWGIPMQVIVAIMRWSGKLKAIKWASKAATLIKVETHLK
jgi:hypothetical protein